MQNISGKERVGWKWGLEFNGHLHFNTQNSSSRLKGNTKSLFNIVFSLTCWIHGALNKDLPMNCIFSGAGLAETGTGGVNRGKQEILACKENTVPEVSHESSQPFKVSGNLLTGEKSESERFSL